MLCPRSCSIAGLRGHQGEFGLSVDVPDPGPDHRVGAAKSVLPGEPGHVGLEDRDARHADAPRGPRPSGAKRDRRGQVDQVGLEGTQDLLDPPSRQTELELAVSGQTDAGDRDDREARVGLRPRPGRDDQSLVAPAGQVLEDPAYRVRDAVHLRQEGFCDKCDPHDRNVPGGDGFGVTRAGSAGEHWPQDRCEEAANRGTYRKVDGGFRPGAGRLWITCGSRPTGIGRPAAGNDPIR